MKSKMALYKTVISNLPEWFSMDDIKKRFNFSQSEARSMMRALEGSGLIEPVFPQEGCKAGVYRRRVDV